MLESKNIQANFKYSSRGGGFILCKGWFIIVMISKRVAGVVGFLFYLEGFNYNLGWGWGRGVIWCNGQKSICCYEKIWNWKHENRSTLFLVPLFASITKIVLKNIATFAYFNRNFFLTRSFCFKSYFRYFPYFHFHFIFE